jgi:hypothetical protein
MTTDGCHELWVDCHSSAPVGKLFVSRYYKTRVRFLEGEGIFFSVRHIVQTDSHPMRTDGCFEGAADNSPKLNAKIKNDLPPLPPHAFMKWWLGIETT